MSFLKKDNFIFRDRGRAGEGERNINSRENMNQFPFVCAPPNQGPNLQCRLLP